MMRKGIVELPAAVELTKLLEADSESRLAMMTSPKRTLVRWLTLPGLSSVGEWVRGTHRTRVGS